MPKWFQKLYYKESIQAIKDSLDFLFYENFKNAIVLSLPQESLKSRERIACNILNRFFPDKNLENFMAKIWKSYNDDGLLSQLFRYYFLENEPVIKEFYLKNVLTKEQDSLINIDVFKKYIIEKYCKEEKNLIWWLQSTLRDLGFIYKIKDKWYKSPIVTPEKATLLLIFDLFFEKVTNTNINDIYNSQFWNLLGIESKEELDIIITKSTLLNIINVEDNIISPAQSLENILESGISVLN